MVQLLCNLRDGTLTASNAFAVDVVRGTRREPAESAEYYLEVLPNVVTRHRHQHGVKLSAASEIMLVPLTLTGTDRVGVMHMFSLRRRSGHALDANVRACACVCPQPGCSRLCRSQQSLRRIKCHKWASMFAKNAPLNFGATSCGADAARFAMIA